MSHAEIQNPLETALQDAMMKLETALLTPVVSGELASWTGEVEQFTTEVDSSLRTYIDQVLHNEYQEIAKSNAEMLERVQQMHQEEHAMLEELAQFHKDLDHLAQRAELDRRDEVKMAEHHSRVVKRGNQLVLDIKRQCVEAATWLSEAVYRDRGRGD
jgi:hypothetical protein